MENHIQNIKELKGCRKWIMIDNIYKIDDNDKIYEYRKKIEECEQNNEKY